MNSKNEPKGTRMKLMAEREKLLGPLQAVIGVVERRQTMPVLANVLLNVRDGRMSITATDLEVELVAATDVTVQSAGDITIKTITCVQFCIWGHCIVCCSLPQGGFFCGSRIIIHTP